MLRIALAQINPIVGDLNGNSQKVIEYIRRARQTDACIVAFPELVVSGYPPEDLLFKRHFLSDCRKAISSIARTVKDITAVIGCVDVDDSGRLFNGAFVIHDGKIIDRYHKHDLPNYGVFDEERYFKAGDSFKVYSRNNMSFAVNVCEDIWRDDGVHKEQSRAGAQLLINVSSSPYDLGKLKERERLLRRRARETNCYVAYVNLIGGQDELVFDGNSFIFSSKGECIASGKAFEEDFVVADLDISRSRKKLKPGMTCKIPDADVKPYRAPIKKQKSEKFTQLERIYKALVLGTHDYVVKNGFQKVLVGLSGGIDSSLVAAVAVDALGPANVIGVTMPSQHTSKGTKTDAGRLARKLGIEMVEIPIRPIYQSYEKALRGEFQGREKGVAEENIQARIRGNLLMALSNKFGWMVLTTGNKSEVAVGYCTLYGDMSGGFSVLKDVPKTKVYALARLRNKTSEVIPKSVIKRAPSAELRQNQKDQDSLPNYDVLDRMLEQYVENHQSYKSMVRKNKKKLVEKIINLIDHNEYKRRQTPPGIKITQRAFGKDWRLPITNKYKEF